MSGYEWISGGNTTITHKKKIDVGGEGAIHAVFILFMKAF
jgi:hypothetical protein